MAALRAVLAAGANVTTPDINGGSPLHYAAQMCGATYEGKLSQANSHKLALEILGILLAHPQCSVDVEDKDGRQPLLWAASAGSAKAILALVKAGARVETADKLVLLRTIFKIANYMCVCLVTGMALRPYIVLPLVVIRSVLIRSSVSVELPRISSIPMAVQPYIMLSPWAMQMPHHVCWTLKLIPIAKIVRVAHQPIVVVPKDNSRQ